MSPDDVEILKMKISELMVRFEERWKSHDARSEERWEGMRSFHKEIKESLEDLSSKVNGLPCSARAENTKSIWLNIRALWGTVVAVCLAMLTAFITHLFSTMSGR